MLPSDERKLKPTAPRKLLLALVNIRDKPTD
jgi:hypothetical protein